MRGTLPLVRGYFVFIAGREKRSKPRLGLDDSPRPNILGRIISAVVLLIMLALLAFLLIGVMAA